MAEPQDDLGDDALFVRGLASRIRSAVKRADGERVEGGRDFLRQLANTLIDASNESDPIKALGSILDDDSAGEGEG